MSKMFVLCGIVMLHAVVAVRDSAWLSNSPHHSMEREQIAYEPSSDEIREFQRALQSLESPMSATKEQARVIIPRLRNMKRFRFVKHWSNRVSGFMGLGRYARVFMPLNVSASAVSFCSELMKEGVRSGWDSFFMIRELKDAKDICPKVLTGSLKPADGKAKNWEVEAAKVSQMHGEKHPFGRLDKVAWRSSLHRVCTDECNALVDGMKNQASQHGIGSQLVGRTWKMMKGIEDDSVEEICADSVTEMNILQGSTREKLCDSTLTEH